MQGGPGSTRRSDVGFTLLGVVVIVSVIATLVMVVMPPILLGITVSKEEETRRQLAYLMGVMTGALPGETYGFLGDVGRLPKSLEELNSTSGTHTLCDNTWNPSIVNYHQFDGNQEHEGHLSMGWRGPYVTEMFASGDYLIDAWGQKLQYSCPESTKPSTDPTTGGVALTLRTGQIRSGGPDGVLGNGDDIRSDAFYDRGHIFMTVTVGSGATTPQTLDVTLSYPQNGEQTSILSEPQSVGVGSSKVIVFSSVPAGVRFININLGARNEYVHIQWQSNVVNRIAYVVPIR